MPVTWEDVERILTTSKSIAVVGLSDKPDRDSHQIAGYLQQAGYRIIPVNPRIAEALGEKAYPSLRDIPERVDVVQIFRRSEEVPPVVDEAIAIGAKVIWMQSGIVHEEAAARAEAAGVTVVMDACMRSAHRALRAPGSDAYLISRPTAPAASPQRPADSPSSPDAPSDIPGK